MILISHRGNLNGPNPSVENSIQYINKAIELGFDVEIDIWNYENKWILGHDIPQYEIDFNFLLSDKLWCHAKNIQALFEMKKRNIKKYFWHENDKFTLTSNNLIWTYPGNILTSESICVLPELNNKKDFGEIAGICSDYIMKYKK